MTPLPYKIYSASAVRLLDEIAINEFDVPGIKLMTRAGTAAFDALCARWPDAGRIIVFCGAGNNGGDGYVVARLARERGFDVTLVALSDPDGLRGDAKLAWSAAKSAGMTITPYRSSLLKHHDVVVDALFGTGLDRDITGKWAEAIEEINASEVPVISIDIPSGLNSNTGNVLGCAVKADITMTYIGLKQGLFCGSARDYCGEIMFDDLDIPQAVYEKVPAEMRRVDIGVARKLLPVRSRTIHKGDNGHVVIVGGNKGMAGAVRLAAEAALRVGSGLVSVITRDEHVAAMSASLPEVMWLGIDDLETMRELCERASVIAIGPGLGRDGWARGMFNRIADCDVPKVIDADALNLLSLEPLSEQKWVLTPHPGEAARLLGATSVEINHNRPQAVTGIAQRFGGIAVLKGAGTLIYGGELQRINICNEGNPGMACGGMGDALTGVIAGLIAQGLSLEDAAVAGVSIHARAGDVAARLGGERGMTVRDLIKQIRGIIN